MNKCGLISGNLKRHFKARHRAYVANLYGEDLLREVIFGCAICMAHAHALEAEMSKVR